TLTLQIEEFLRANPLAQWHQYEPVNYSQSYQGALLAFGENLKPIYHFDRAEIVLSLESDFLFHHPSHLLWSRQFVGKRQDFLNIQKKKSQRDPKDPKNQRDQRDQNLNKGNKLYV